MNLKKTVLVTGAHGFIGRYTAKHFQDKGYYVIGLGQGHWEEDEWKKWGINAWFEGAISKDYLIDSLDHRPDYIIYCAGSGSVSYSYENPAQDFNDNVSSLLTVLEYIRNNSPSTSLVYPSSAAVYGNRSTMPRPMNEEEALMPISPYGFHKKMAEELCQSYRSNYGINASIIRFFSVYGPGLKKQLLFDCCEKVRHDNPVFYGTGDETRDFLHVEDAVSLFYYAANCETKHSAVFNGGTGKSITIREIVEKVFYYFNYSKKPSFNRQQRDGDPLHYLADISKTMKLGWRPVVEIEYGIKEYVDWYKGLYLC